MKTSRPFPRSIVALALGLLALGVVHAPAQTVIHSVPYTITASGRYVLGGNLTNTVDATPGITINAPNVILDLNGYYVAGPNDKSAAFSLYRTGILVGDVANVTIRNGTIAGYVYGILFSSTNAATARNYIVDGVTITRCYADGIYLNNAAPGSVVKNCTFTTIGNSTAAANTFPDAIRSNGGVRIQGNNIGDVTATGGGTSYGIAAAPSDFVIGNTIANCNNGVNNGKYLNNLTFNVMFPFGNGTNATGNN